jgi:hypothetical protein
MKAEIQILGEHEHRKASEKYSEVRYVFEDGLTWEGWIPTHYRRTGLFLESPEEIEEYLLSIGSHLHQAARDTWVNDQQRYWDKELAGMEVTKPIFEKLLSLDWCCTNHSFGSNTNIARRYQEIKEMGYTLASDKNRACPECQKRRLHLLLIPLPLGAETGYEVWSPALRKRIVKVLGSYDAFEGRKTSPHGLLPDHKFPEIRWDAETRRGSLEGLDEDQIRGDFQLLNNQRNQQKREVCRTCYQTGIRGFPFGIKYFYQGANAWPNDLPATGKGAESGCLGCGWYDFQAWREALNSRLQSEEASMGM